MAFCHTVLSYPQFTKIKTILIVCPVSTLLNWELEFRNWLPEDQQLEIFKLWEEKKPTKKLQQWIANGGVGIINYEKLQNLITGGDAEEVILKTLLNPGPDIIVCDEGHLLKNPKTNKVAALSKIRTKKRIILTGTPLQNNLGEYHAMVNFINPFLLGSLKTFQANFIDPITSGQSNDNTQQVSDMKYSLYVLHKLLEKYIHRRDVSILKPHLPLKLDYCILIKSSLQQIKLYKKHVLRGNVKPLDDYIQSLKIMAHPSVFLKSKKKETNIEESGKMSLLKAIIEKCNMVGDRLLVFSQSIETLNEIQEYLQRWDAIAKESKDLGGRWRLGIEFFRLVGDMSAEKRQRNCATFNTSERFGSTFFLS